MKHRSVSKSELDEKVVKVAIHGPVEEYLAHPNSFLSPAPSSGYEYMTISSK